MNQEGRNFAIQITSGSIVRAALFIILFIFLYYIRDLILVILAAVVIASAVEPVTRRLARFKIKRLPAVLLVYLLIAGALAIFFVFFLPSLLNESISYLNNLPESIKLSDFWSPLRDSGFLSSGTAGNAVNALSSQSFSIKELIEGFRTVVSGAGSSGGAFQTVSVVFGGALSFVLMIVLSFYLAVQEDGVSNFLKIISPVRMHDYIIGLWKRSQRKIGFWMQGQLLLGLLVGILVYLGLMIFVDQTHALLLASIAAIFEIIPVFGPILAAIPAILIAFVDGGAEHGVARAITVIVIYLIIHQFENHLLYPLVVKKIVGVSPILVILALVIGAKLAGFIGAILAVPIAAALMEYVHDIEKERGVANV
jgi:predicted PurR-regulated permease PerM